MPTPTKFAVKNTTTNRLTFEVRDEQGRLVRYLKVGSTLDDALVKAGRPALGSRQVFPAEDVTRLRESSPIFRSMLDAGTIQVSAAA